MSVKNLIRTSTQPLYLIYNQSTFNIIKFNQK